MLHHLAGWFGGETLRCLLLSHRNVLAAPIRASQRRVAGEIGVADIEIDALAVNAIMQDMACRQFDQLSGAAGANDERLQLWAEAIHADLLDSAERAIGADGERAAIDTELALWVLITGDCIVRLLRRHRAASFDAGCLAPNPQDTYHLQAQQPGRSNPLFQGDTVARAHLFQIIDHAVLLEAAGKWVFGQEHWRV